MADSTTTTCAESKVVDTLVKSALVGAIAYVGYTWAVNEGVIGAGLGARAAKFASGKAKGFLVR
jgi:L-aminopeptidase/D-esterase-like protein